MTYLLPNEDLNAEGFNAEDLNTEDLSSEHLNPANHLGVERSSLQIPSKLAWFSNYSCSVSWPLTLAFYLKVD